MIPFVKVFIHSQHSTPISELAYKVDNGFERLKITLAVKKEEKNISKDKKWQRINTVRGLKNFKTKVNNE
jgi:hypothetical protein